ncbi:GNAT family N-acetyltransferase [Mesotoga sp. BH458_6_3_2_1]|jgi:GNAT superfamily N-acetyltransferase|uniref:GNAT family N-acetyltransferase n=2 Tax=unclassified Mesotoga TaxID=1184398 RepID=UPI001C7CDD06|nr:GNAT family N-acetyltransferase [Mesotoga sp. BH458_6_3_2_1]
MIILYQISTEVQMEIRNGDYTVTDNKEMVSRDLVKRYILDSSYWGKNRTEEQIDRSIDSSLCFSLLMNIEQIGFARVISDFATIYYLADVFVLEEFRGNGLGKWLVECVLAHEKLRGLRGMLNTKDAHSLYERFGFNVAEPQSTMIRLP